MSSKIVGLRRQRLLHGSSGDVDHIKSPPYSGKGLSIIKLVYSWPGVDTQTSIPKHRTLTHSPTGHPLLMGTIFKELRLLFT
jgi:hypothetical protein